MLNDAGAADGDLVNPLLASWDRLLLIISLPHAAAYSAFLGKFDFSAVEPKPEYSYLVSFGMMVSIPILTVWLYYVYDLLRNTFLRVGHMGLAQKIRHSLSYTIVFSFPLLFVLLSAVPQSEPNAAAEVLIGMVLYSWVFCAVMAANGLYRKAAQALGIETND